MEIIHWTSLNNAFGIFKTGEILCAEELRKRGIESKSIFRYGNDDEDKVHFSTCKEVNQSSIGLIFDSNEINAKRLNKNEQTKDASIMLDGSVSLKYLKKVLIKKNFNDFNENKLREFKELLAKRDIPCLEE